MPVISVISFVGLMIIIGFIAWHKKMLRKNQRTNEGKKSAISLGKVNTGRELYITRLLATNRWWTDMDKSAQLQLAIELAERTLPVWEQNADRYSLRYTENANESERFINTNLLRNSLKRIRHHMTTLASKDNSEFIELRYYYDQFITPVMALTDGYWKLPYADKKVFYSVYQILKGLVDNDHPGVNMEFTNSINNSLEVIDISELLTEKQVRNILEPYKDKLMVQKNSAQRVK